MAGTSVKAAGRVENKFKYNDCTELQHQEFSDGSGLELYSTEFRSFDAQIGRFHQIDPLGGVSDNFSPYAYVLNNPFLYNDPLGLDTVNVGFKKGQSTAAAANADGSKGSYQKTENGGIEGTGMSGSSDVTVASKKKAKKPETNTQENLVIDISRWRTQAPNWSACFTTCQLIAGYTAPNRLIIQTARENGKILQILPAAQQGVQTIDSYLAASRPIIVGVNHTLGRSYNEGTTDHYVVIVGSGRANGTTYYRFYDPGTLRMAAGTSPLNRLYLQSNFSLQGTTEYNGRTYTVSQVSPSN